MQRVRTIIAAFVITGAVALGAPIAMLQSSTMESLTINVGEVFEIAAIGGENVAWVLTANGEFSEAATEPVFSTRMTQEGTYMLDTIAQMNGEQVTRTFTILVERTPQDEADTTSDTVFAFIDGVSAESAALTDTKHVVRIEPVRSDINVLAIDFDATVDTSGDDNPQNDEDTRGTLFRDGGSPIHLWFVGGTPRTIRLGALLEDGKTLFRTVRVGDAAGGEIPGGSIGDDRIRILSNDNGEVELMLAREADPSNPILVLWKFGDGAQSMLDRPIHVYAESGEYTIEAEIRDLRTGEVIETIESSVVVNRLREDTEPEPTEKPAGPSMLGTVLKLIGLLIVFAIVGALVMFVIGKLRRKGFSLEKAVEKAEKTLVKPQTVSVEPPPLEIRATEVTEREIDEPVVVETPPERVRYEEPPAPPVAPVQERVQPEAPRMQSAEAPAPRADHTPLTPSTEQLASDTSKAPEWLQAGIKQAAAQGQTPQTPPQAELQSKPPMEPALPKKPDMPPAAAEVEPKAANEPEKPAAPVAPPAQQTTELNEAEERERERKRKKRQRYRENLRQRKDGNVVEPVLQAPVAQPVPEPEGVPENPDEPVAFIRAEDIKPLEEDQK